MGPNSYCALASVSPTEIGDNFDFTYHLGRSHDGNLYSSIRKPLLRHRIRRHRSQNCASIVILQYVKSAMIRSLSLVLQPELKGPFAKAFEN